MNSSFIDIIHEKINQGDTEVPKSAVKLFLIFIALLITSTILMSLYFAGSGTKQPTQEERINANRDIDYADSL